MMSIKKLVLQNRWEINNLDSNPFLLYYGVRNPPRHGEVMVEVSPKLASVIKEKGWIHADAETDEIKRLREEGILVLPENRKKLKTLDDMQVCERCVTNDYVVPGLEFDDKGVCALCQCYEQVKVPDRSAFNTVAGEELVAAAKNNGDSRFDVMLLYTGGKDSSYLLWLLARKLKLRVLAAFWNMPYCSDAAYENIAKAKKRMPEVEFLEWTLPLNKVHEAMIKKWRSHGWPCLCPSVAFAVFYPLAAQMRVPYVFLGLEDVQASVLDYVVAKPGNKIAAPASDRDRTLAFLSVRALPRSIEKPVRWSDEMTNYHAAVRNSMPDVFAELGELVMKARSDKLVFMPVIGKLSTNEQYGTWQDVRSLLEKEMDWSAPAAQESLLHTSCILEPLKDYLQFHRFKSMRTVFMPQSIVELGAAVYFGLVSRDQALRSISELGYFKEPESLSRLLGELGLTGDDVRKADDELPSGLAEWAGI